MELKLDDIAAHLQKVKQSQGEEAYRTALTGFARQLLASGDGTTAFLDQLLVKLDTDLDLGPLKEEAERIREKRGATSAAGRDMNQVMVDAMKQQMSNLKTQVQFDLVMRGFEALQHYLNAAFGNDTDTAAKLREGLIQVLDLAPRLGEVTEKLEDSPEAASDQDFVRPPREYTEADVQQRLLLELAAIDTMNALQTWYAENKKAMDDIRSTELRNRLFDAIRTAKGALLS